MILQRNILRFLAFQGQQMSFKRSTLNSQKFFSLLSHFETNFSAFWAILKEILIAKG